MLTLVGSRDAHIECLDCHETGFVFLKEIGSSGTFLMRCLCEYGGRTETKFIPQWSRQLLGVFERLPFPVKSFNPGIEEGVGIFQESFWTKVENWKAKIGLSEDYWKYQIEKQRGER